MVAKVLSSLTTNVILGKDLLHKYNPHIDWSQNTLSFVLDSYTVAVDLAWYWGLFVQGLFLLAFGFANFVLNLSQTAFWWWCILVMVKRGRKMQLIRNTLRYMVNLLTCLSSLGYLHII